MANFDTVMYEPTLRMMPTGLAVSLCNIVEPYFERAIDHFSGHSYTPPNRPSPYSAIVQNANAITFAAPMFTAFGKHGNEFYRQLIGNCITRLMPDPLVQVGGPVHLEATVVQAGSRTVVHLNSFLASRQAEGLDLVHDPFPIVDVPISIRMTNSPKVVTLQPEGASLQFTFADGYLHTKAAVLDGHAMIVIDARRTRRRDG